MRAKLIHVAALVLVAVTAAADVPWLMRPTSPNPAIVFNASPHKVISDEGRVLWSPAELSVIDPTEMDLATLRNYVVPRTDQQTESNSAQCDFLIGERMLSGHYGSDTLSEAVQSATAVYVGTVVEETQGFLLGLPATLLTLRLDGHNGTVLVASPFAHFKYSAQTYCAVGVGGDTNRPEVGDQLIVFSREGSFGPIVYASTAETIVNRDGRAQVPANLDRDPDVVKAGHDAARLMQTMRAIPRFLSLTQTGSAQ